jgi:hypothetical protein
MINQIIINEKKPLFGSIEQEKIYRQVKRSIIDGKMLRLYQKHECSEVITITICNLWRLIRTKNKTQIRVEKRDIFNNTWGPSECFKLYLLPLNKSNGAECWLPLFSQAIREIFTQHGINPFGQLEDGTPVGKLVGIITRKYIPNDEKKPEKNLLQRDKLEGASKALIKNLWNEMIDNETLRLVAKIVGFPTPITLKQYIECSDKTVEMARINRERPNLMALLLEIPKKMWGRSDLFSSGVWVKGDKKSTIIERNSGFLSFDNKTQQKWLFSKKSSFIRKFYKLGTDVFNKKEQKRSMTALGYMIEAKLEHNLLNTILEDIFSECLRYIPGTTYELPKKQLIQYLRLLKKHDIQLWKEKGYRAVRVQNWRLTQHYSMLSWLKHDGIARGLPDKNSTMKSLYENSHIWHNTTYLRRTNGNYSWTSLLDEHQHGDYIIKPLTNSKTLFDEGYDMKHCVQHYDHDCRRKIIEIFSMQSRVNPKNRYTLCLENQDGNWVIEQCHGLLNSDPPLEALIVAENTLELMKNAASAHNENVLLDRQDPLAA